MCLIAKNLPEKCKKTIVVYKNLEIGNTYLKTPYQRTKIISPIMIAEPILSENNIKHIYIGDEVKEGFIHSLQDPITTYLPRVGSVKAYIPKGTFYIRGSSYDIASTKLILDPRDVYKKLGYKFPLSDRIKFFLWRIIHLIK